MDDLDKAQKDYLTGFYTRENLVISLKKRMVDANLHNEKFSILLVDIDHFKKINDKYGHLWGDEFLKYVASTLRLTLQDKGLIFRYGGDEFVVLFSENDPKQSFSLSKQFNRVMKNRPFLFNGRLFKVTISCGQACYPDDAQKTEELLKAADKALYFSKRFGRNTTTRASKIGVHRVIMGVVVFLEVCAVIFAVHFIQLYVFKGSFKRTFNRVWNTTKSLPVGLKADTTIVLKSGDVILGQIVSEDKNTVIVNVALGQGSCMMNIEKKLIKKITHKEDEGK